MCTPTNHFKFCTCTEKLSEEEADWVLYRQDFENLIVGSMDYVFLDSETPSAKARQKLTDRIIHDLNHFNCFDFEYVPKEGDYLYIKAKGINPYYIYYENDSWVSEKEKKPFTLYLESNHWGRVAMPL